MLVNKEYQKLRRLALTTWIESQGGIKRVIKNNQLSNNVRSQIYCWIRGYSFGAVAARNIEIKLGIPAGYLDSLAEEAKTDQPWIDGIDSDGKEIGQDYCASDLISTWNTKNIRHFPLDRVAVTHNSMLTSNGSGHFLVLDNDVSIITDFRVSEKWFKTHVPPVEQIDKLYVVTGMSDSENPAYCAGDPILIDAGINIIETDAVYFFKLKQMHFIKRVQLAANGVTTIMHPNDIFDSFVVTPDMDFQVLGKVLKIWRSESYV